MRSPVKTIDDIRAWSAEDENGCWIWLRGLNGDGYASIWFDGRARSGHKLAYELDVGPVPAAMVLDHTCRVRHCVNPAHLEVVTHAQNTLRGEGGPARNAVKTHCDNGHPFDEANTYIGRGWRQCRACNREAVRRYKSRRAGAPA